MMFHYTEDTTSIRAEMELLVQDWLPHEAAIAFDAKYDKLKVV